MPKVGDRATVTDGGSEWFGHVGRQRGSVLESEKARGPAPHPADLLGVHADELKT